MIDTKELRIGNIIDYKEFCLETKRSGGVLCGSSIGEWHFYLASKLVNENNKISGT